MANDLHRRTRSFTFASLFALGIAAVATGCGAHADGAPGADEGAGEGGEEGASTEAITQVNHSSVKRQSIGNCWLYASVGWAEALHTMQANEEVNLSESYLTYWHWFEQIVGEQVDEISTGGSWDVAAGLMDRYGLMIEGDFIANEASAEMSARQASAESAINAALKTGALKDQAKRRDRAAVRKALDAAWAIGGTGGAAARLDAVFGKSVSKTIDKSYARAKPPETSKVVRAADFSVKVRDVKDGKPADWKEATLKDVIGTGSWRRSGPLAWQDVNYPSWSAASKRDFQKRIQRALHDGQPVIFSWHVDFNALGRDSTFKKETQEESGRVGRTGGHMVLGYDYQATGVPGFGTLKAGELETRKEALEAALANETKIEFIRVKNSWGKSRPDRWDSSVLPGYHDLYMSYLEGPLKDCKEGTALGECSSTTTPWWDVTLPAGY